MSMCDVLCQMILIKISVNVLFTNHKTVQSNVCITDSLNNGAFFTKRRLHPNPRLEISISWINISILSATDILCNGLLGVHFKFVIWKFDGTWVYLKTSEDRLENLHFIDILQLVPGVIVCWHGSIKQLINRGFFHFAKKFVAFHRIYTDRCLPVLFLGVRWILYITNLFNESSPQRNNSFTFVPFI